MNEKEWHILTEKAYPNCSTLPTLYFLANFCCVEPEGVETAIFVKA